MPLGGDGWTLEELAAAVALALSHQNVGQASGRVSSTPSRRTIRYYVTRGLLDPPLRFRGRTAVYGYRHLTQLVTIKKLQARGSTLQQIQRRMAGLDDAGLGRFAEIPDDRPLPGPPPPSRPDRSNGRIVEMSAVRLHENVVLMLEQIPRSLDGDDLQAITAAAAPLLKLLQARRVLG